ncbi:hypothetical protein GCM10011608_55650 [Micromonospora sonchi]|uniref:Uncharacterized protein n=1 Tax=Micromonospora sonchi TaxID=1763543 RepID=A0A917X2V2_9ACTN|nr:hypothetical protein [Micromonospora sonchi]GGM63275.1 hypothetical protein GCM10011608_55650 [Micromonospora sonchi]
MTGHLPGEGGIRRSPAANPVPTFQSATYIILTSLRPDSGLMIGSVRAVAHAESTRRLYGAGSRDALVAVYVRIADALMLVEVEATELSSAAEVRRYLIRTWLHQQLLGQCELAVHLDRQ